MYFTYDIVRRVPAHIIQKEHRLGPNTIAEFGLFCRETMLMYVEGCSEKFGGPNKTVEIDQSKFGRRKYYMGHPVKGKWVFGRFERESGKKFLAPVPDTTADSLKAVIDAWIEPGTTVISDCWVAYRDFDAEYYTHRTVNHSIDFVDELTGAHTNNIKSTWRVVKAFLSPSYGKGDYINRVGHYMCAVRCRAEKVNQFTKFMFLVTMM